MPCYRGGVRKMGDPQVTTCPHHGFQLRTVAQKRHRWPAALSPLPLGKARLVDHLAAQMVECHWKKLGSWKQHLNHWASELFQKSPVSVICLVTISIQNLQVWFKRSVFWQRLMFRMFQNTLATEAAHIHPGSMTSRSLAPRPSPAQWVAAPQRHLGLQLVDVFLLPAFFC